MTWSSTIRIYQLSGILHIIITIFNMALCINCNIRLRGGQEHYVYDAIDMGPEPMSLVEEWIGREVSDGYRLCHGCMNLVMIEVSSRNEGNSDGGRQLGHQDICVNCGISVSRRTGRRSHVLNDEESVYIANLISPRQIGADARVCHSCWQRVHQTINQRRNVPVPVVPVPVVPVPEVELPSGTSGTSSALTSLLSSEQNSVAEQPAERHITIEGYRRTGDTSVHCFVPDCLNNQRRRLPVHLKRKILADHRLYVTSNARICDEHRVTYNWEFIDEYEFITDLRESDVKEMLELLRTETKTVLDFENVEDMNDNVCHYWTGKTVLQFLAIFTIINQQLGDACRKPKTAFAVFLVKLRSGEPYRRLASLFCLSKTVICKYIRESRNCLLHSYVPLHLGLDHMPRANMSLRNLLIPQGLFGTVQRNPIVICDGTYIYMQKSSNYLFQKKSYSLHKYTNLVKPFLFVATDGHILDVCGPYAATTSDADIMKQLFQNQQMPLRNYFRENDIFILDRGFRDAIGLLTTLGYTVHKPESLQQGESQLTTMNANKSRLVTLCRWVVEVVNGRFKRDFKIFRNRYFNIASMHLMNDFKIAAAMLNHFHPTITDRADAQSLLDRALARLNMPNHLADYVVSRHLNRRRTSFMPINAQIPALNMFPVMEMSDLILFSLGTYQIKQARSYYGEHIRSNGSFIVEVSQDIEIANVLGMEQPPETVLLRGRIKSRHQSTKIYYVYILLKTEIRTWQDVICGYYCSCIVGKRTVGCCAHVMTIVWYLGWARYQENINSPAEFLDHILVREDIENEDVE